MLLSLDIHLHIACIKSVLMVVLHSMWNTSCVRFQMTPSVKVLRAPCWGLPFNSSMSTLSFCFLPFQGLWFIFFSLSRAQSHRRNGSEVQTFYSAQDSLKCIAPSLFHLPLRNCNVYFTLNACDWSLVAVQFRTVFVQCVSVLRKSLSFFLLSSCIACTSPPPFQLQQASFRVSLISLQHVAVKILPRTILMQLCASYGTRAIAEKVKTCKNLWLWLIPSSEMNSLP